MALHKRKACPGHVCKVPNPWPKGTRAHVGRKPKCVDQEVFGGA